MPVDEPCRHRLQLFSFNACNTEANAEVATEVIIYDDDARLDQIPA